MEMCFAQFQYEIHSFIYLFIKHIHIDGRKQDNGTGQQGTHSTLTVGLQIERNYCCQTIAIKSITYTLQIC